MALLVVAPDRDLSELIGITRQLAPAIDIRTAANLGDTKDIRFAVVWKQPVGLLARLPNLTAVSSLGAGVEHLTNDPGLPDHLPVGRLAGPRLAAEMAAWLVAQVVSHWRNMDAFVQQQALRQWQPPNPRPTPGIGILGLGTMGWKAAAAFQALDLPVVGFSRSGQGPDGVVMHAGQDGLAQVASLADYLICLLPLTNDTRGILDARLFAAMKPDSVLINVGRGEHLVEEDLIAALDAGRPGAALLDTFQTEPLPKTHPFWAHPRIRVTPHCASITDPQEAARLLIESYRRVEAGQPPLGLVDRQKGY